MPIGPIQEYITASSLVNFISVNNILAEDIQHFREDTQTEEDPETPFIPEEIDKNSAFGITANSNFKIYQKNLSTRPLEPSGSPDL